MEYFTDLIGKQVVSIFDQNFVGTLYNIDIDWKRKKIKNLTILSSDEETMYTISPHKVYSIGDCITIRNNADLIISTETDNAQKIGIIAIGISGKFYGKINEISFENWRPQLLYTNETIDISKILCFSTNFVLINDLDKKTVLHNFKPKNTTITADSTQTVSILDNLSSVVMPKTITAQNSKTTLI